MYLFSFAMLNIILIVFFLFSPMTFAYYLLVPMTLSALQTWMVLAR